MINHPYVKYAQALLKNESSGKMSSQSIRDAIEFGIEHFSLEPSESYEGKDIVRFKYLRDKNDAKRYHYLSPHIMATEMKAGNLHKGAITLSDELKKGKDDDLLKGTDITMSENPMSGEFLSFSTSIGRGKAKCSKYEQSLCLITSLTPYKPSLQVNGENVCIIPDLSVEQLCLFIDVFKRMQLSKTQDLMMGRVKKEESKNKVTYKPLRPSMFNGNFPNAPQSNALCKIALLGAIGEFAKIAEWSDDVNEVLESLKNATMYIIKYGHANVFSYNNHIIDIAKKSKLNRIISSIYHTKLYNEDKRYKKGKPAPEYEKFDMLASRFLLLFNEPSFKDFLSFRAEYHSEIGLLFKTYFSKMENIDIQIIKSARSLGSWLNYVAYKAAEQDTPQSTANYWDVLRQKKAKVLVELESSVFSSKSGDSLIWQVITRAGRLVGMDAPSEAIPFMEKAASGELELDKAKNLLIAFSRVKSMAQVKETKQEDAEKAEEPEDYSEI